MATTDLLAPERIAQVAAQLRSRLATVPRLEQGARPFAELMSDPIQGPKIHETFKVFRFSDSALTLDASTAGAVSSLEPYIWDTKRWHHQIHILHSALDQSGQAVAFARSRSSEQEQILTQTTTSPLAEAVDNAITFIDNPESGSGIPSSVVVRLLTEPSRFLFAFHIVAQVPKYEKILLVSLPPYTTREHLEENNLYDPSEFLDGMIRTPGAGHIPVR